MDLGSKLQTADDTLLIRKIEYPSALLSYLDYGLNARIW